MRKLTLTLSILCGMAALAYAGPETLPSGKEMKAVAPMPPACPNWSGFYVGGFGGYKFSVVNTDLQSSEFFHAHGEPAATLLEQHAPDDLNNSGGELGGLIGFNYQCHTWVFGAEGAGGYLWARDSDNSGVFAVPPGTDAFVIDSSFKTHYLATFGPRIGYAFCNWLPYVTGGLAIGDLDYEQNYTDLGRLPFTFFSRGRETDTNLGWMIGGGLEYALTNHWHLRGQYQYIDLGSIDFNETSEGTLQGAGLFTTHHSAELREHNASFAIIYKF